MMPKFSSQDADKILARLDRVASIIKANAPAWGMPQNMATEILHDIDATADDIEIAAFGKESFERRQMEVMKQAAQQRQAEVVHRETDEPYMQTFANPMAPIQTEADEPYMKAYGAPDQSSAVLHGQSTTGRPLTPHKNDTPSPV